MCHESSSPVKGVTARYAHKLINNTNEPAHVALSCRVAACAQPARLYSSNSRTTIPTNQTTGTDSEVGDRDRAELNERALKALRGDRTSYERLTQSASRGDHFAEAFLSLLYWEGNKTVPEDAEKADMYARRALPWLQVETEKGCPYAQLLLGYCYQFGKGSLAMDQAKAVKYFELAAKQGLIFAMLSLALCNEHGIGITRNEAEAARYYRLAADKGDGVAQAVLGTILLEGIGVAKNEEEAVRYYTLAAEQGHCMARELVSKSTVLWHLSTIHWLPSRVIWMRSMSWEHSIRRAVWAYLTMK